MCNTLTHSVILFWLFLIGIFRKFCSEIPDRIRWSAKMDLSQDMITVTEFLLASELHGKGRIYGEVAWLK